MTKLPNHTALKEWASAIDALGRGAQVILIRKGGIADPTFGVEAELAPRGGGVDGDAIAVDFVSAKRKLEALAKRLDYGCINDIAPFDRLNPSAENIAEWFWRELSAGVAAENAVVTAVTIWEGPVNSVTFRPQNLS